MKSVLMAEDDAATRALVTDALSELDTCVVRAVADGAALLAVLETVRPALIILDVNMPGLKGPEVYRLVRDRAESATVPVLFISAQSRTALEGVEGSYRWLAKPFDIDELLQVVGAMIGRDVTETVE